jgi:hypothetical protein
MFTSSSLRRGLYNSSKVHLHRYNVDSYCSIQLHHGEPPSASLNAVRRTIGLQFSVGLQAVFDQGIAKITRLLSCILQDWMAFEGTGDFRGPFPRFGNQPAWAVVEPLYLNALLLRNLTVEVVNFVICSSNTSKHARAWRKAISKPIPDVGLHVVAEKGGQ